MGTEGYFWVPDEGEGPPSWVPGDSMTDEEIQAALDLKQDLAEKAQNGGYAPLDGSGLVPLAHLPAEAPGGVTDHPTLTDRDAVDSHPQSAVTDLVDDLAFMLGGVQAANASVASVGAQAQDNEEAILALQNAEYAGFYYATGVVDAAAFHSGYDSYAGFVPAGAQAFSEYDPTVPGWDHGEVTLWESDGAVWINPIRLDVAENIPKRIWALVNPATGETPVARVIVVNLNTGTEYGAVPLHDAPVDYSGDIATAQQAADNAGSAAIGAQVSADAAQVDADTAQGDATTAKDWVEDFGWDPPKFSRLHIGDNSYNLIDPTTKIPFPAYIDTDPPGTGKVIVGGDVFNGGMVYLQGMLDWTLNGPWLPGGALGVDAWTRPDSLGKLDGAKVVEGTLIWIGSGDHGREVWAYQWDGHIPTDPGHTITPHFGHIDTVRTEGSTWTNFAGDLLSEVLDDLDNTIDTHVHVPPSTTEAGTTDTVAAADHLGFTVCTNAALVTITFPTDASDDLTVGHESTWYAAGAGGLTVDATGLSFVGGYTPNLTVAQGEGIFIKKTAPDEIAVVGGTAA